MSHASLRLEGDGISSSALVTTVVDVATDVRVELLSFASSVMLLSGKADRTGTSVWQTTRLLGEVLAGRARCAVTNARVLELGCGTALLSATCAAVGAAAVLATDGEAAVLPLAAANVRAAVSSRGGRGGEVVAAAAQLRWGDAGHLAAALAWAPRGRFDLVVIGEGLYVHRGAACGSVEEHAALLFGTARDALEPCSCGSVGSINARGANSGCSAGAVLLLFSPRYRGMGAAVRAAAGAAGLAWAPLAARALSSPEARAGALYGDARLAAASPCAVALSLLLGRCDLPVCTEGDGEGIDDAPDAVNVTAGDLFA